MNEATVKQTEQQIKANEKAVKKAAEKFEEEQLSGETGVTPHTIEKDENLLSEPPHKTDSRISKIDIQMSLNSSPKRESAITDPGDVEAFVTRALSSKQTGRQERINSVATICGEDAYEKSSEGSDVDSFCTDSSGDSAFDPSSDDDSDLDEQDKALQQQLIQNFARNYKQGVRLNLIRMETKQVSFSPNNADANNGFQKTKTIKGLFK